jgi:hypothetical protein
VSFGAFMLAWVLWGEDTEAQTAAVASPVAVSADTRELS